MLLILLLHAPVTPLLPPLNGLLVHIFRSALRLPAYKRVNRSGLSLLFRPNISMYFFLFIHFSFLLWHILVIFSISGKYMSIYLFLRHIYVGILFLRHIFVVFETGAYIRQFCKNVIYMTKAKSSINKLFALYSY